MSGLHHATPRPLKVNELMHNGLRREKLYCRFQQPLHASVYPSKLSYSMISMCLHVSCHTFKEDKQAQTASSPRTSVFLPPAQQLSQYIKNHHQGSVFLELLSAHKSQRYHVQILPAQLLSKSFHSFFYYLASSLVCINLWAFTCVLHCREHSPVTLQTQSMTDQNACNNVDFP